MARSSSMTCRMLRRPRMMLSLKRKFWRMARMYTNGWGFCDWKVKTKFCNVSEESGVVISVHTYQKAL